MKKLQMSRMGKFFDALHFNITSPETFVPEFFAADAVTHTYWSPTPIKGHPPDRQTDDTGTSRGRDGWMDGCARPCLFLCVDVSGHAEHIAFYKKYAEHKDTRRFASAPTLLLVRCTTHTHTHTPAHNSHFWPAKHALQV